MQGRLHEAATEFEALLPQARQVLGADHRTPVGAAQHYGSCLLRLKRWSAARSVLAEVRPQLIRIYGPEHALVQANATGYGEATHALGLPATAGELPSE